MAGEPCPINYVTDELLQSHRIIKITEWFGLGGTIKTIKFHPPCLGQGHLPAEQAAQCPSQPGLVTMAQKALGEQKRNVITFVKMDTIKLHSNISHENVKQ